MRRRRRIIAALLALFAILGPAAFAKWASAVGTGTGGVKDYTLTNPTGLSASQTSPPTIHLAWTAPADKTLTGFSYVLTRTGGSGSIGGTCASLIASSTVCDDSSAVGGVSYTYNLKSKIQGWTSSGAVTALNATGPATQLVFTTQPGGGAAGAVWAQQPVVAVKDAANNTVTSYSGNVAVAIGTNPVGGALAGTTTVAVANGVATFSGLSIDKTGTGYTLTATSGSLTSATSGAFNIAIGAATKLAFTPQPSGTNGGAGGTWTATVAIQDAAGNTVTTASANIALTKASGTGNLQNCTAGTGTATAPIIATTNGVATFSCKFSAVGSYTVTAATSGATNPAGGFTSATSNAFSVSGNVGSLVFTTQPGGGTGGVAWAQQPVVTAVDGAGIVVTAFNGGSNTVALTIQTNPGSGTLVCDQASNTATASYGIVTFTGCDIDKKANNYVVKATGGGKNVNSATFNITTGAAALLVITAEPSASSNMNTAFAAQPAVTVEDAGGNPVPSYATGVTLAITSGTGTAGAAFTCTTNPVTPNAVTGVAQFAGCKIGTAGVGYTLTASSAALATDISSAITIIDPAAVAGLKFINIDDNNKTVTCNPTPPAQNVACTVGGLGGTGHFTANVQLINSSGAVVTNNTGSPLTVSQSTATTAGKNGNWTQTPASSAIAVGASASTDVFTITGTASGWGATMTISVTVNGTTYTISIAGS